MHTELHLKAAIKDSLGVVNREAPLLIWTDPQWLPWEEEEREAGDGVTPQKLEILEANPLAGLNPWHSDLPILAAQNGVDFVALIGLILDAGLARYGLALPGEERRRKSA